MCADCSLQGSFHSFNNVIITTIINTFHSTEAGEVLDSNVQTVNFNHVRFIKLEFFKLGHGPYPKHHIYWFIMCFIKENPQKLEPDFTTGSYLFI